MPHYHQFEEPKFVEYESYFLSWYDDNYGSCGLYGEPIGRHQEFNHEPCTLESFEEEVDCTGELLYEDGLTGQVELLDNGKPYFDGNWKEDMFTGWLSGFPNEYGEYDDKLEKAEDGFQGEELYSSCHCYDGIINRQPTYDYGSWFQQGVDEEWRDTESTSVHSAYEMRLCERIFGHWPRPLKPYEESRVENPLA